MDIWCDGLRQWDLHCPIEWCWSQTKTQQHVQAGLTGLDGLCRYQQLFRQQEAQVPVVDVRSLNSNLPLPMPTGLDCPVLVLGCSKDRIVDGEGVAETAAHFGAHPIMLPDVAHDLMLVSPGYQTSQEQTCLNKASFGKCLLALLAILLARVAASWGACQLSCPAHCSPMYQSH